MTSPAYTIGRDELLLITTRWSDGRIIILEVERRPYKASEIQKLIDETVDHNCNVIDVEVYDCIKKNGQSLADVFDVSTWAQRQDAAREERDEADKFDERRTYNALRPSAGNLTHAQQGIGARA